MVGNKAQEPQFHHAAGIVMTELRSLSREHARVGAGLLATNRSELSSTHDSLRKHL